MTINKIKPTAGQRVRVTSNDGSTVEGPVSENNWGLYIALSNTCLVYIDSIDAATIEVLPDLLPTEPGLYVFDFDPEGDQMLNLATIYRRSVNGWWSYAAANSDNQVRRIGPDGMRVIAKENASGKLRRLGYAD